MPGNEATQHARQSAEEIPATSGETHPSQRRSFGADDSAQTDIARPIMSLTITAIVVLFVGFLLFTTLAPDTNDICNDPTNFTTDECDNAQTARGLFITVLVVAEVAILIAILAIAMKAGQGAGPAGGGAPRRGRRRG